ncbi:MAG: DMT family transporter [Mangrovicoccus sp.]|nr:DMT family transporter [Mangrovicoccus sp.]
MDLRAVGMGLSFALIWASAFTSARMIVADAPPLYALSARFALSGVIAILWALWLGQSWRLSRAQWIAVVIFGLCQNAVYLGLFFVAMQTLEASAASIIASAMPLIAAALGFLAFGDRVGALGWAGLATGFVGVAIIMGARLSGGADPVALLLCLIGVSALAVATLAVRGTGSGGNVLMIVGLQMLVGAAALAPFAIAFEQPQITLTPRLILAFAYTTMAPGLLATVIWFSLVNRIGAVKAASFHFLNPVFGLLIAAALLGERISLTDWLGVGVVMLGILAVQRARQAGAGG